MKTVFLAFLLFFANSFSAQNLHIMYANKNSKFTSFQEDLYITKNSVVSVRDSIVKNTFDDKNATNNNQSIYFTKEQLHKIIYYKISKNKIVINDYIATQSYFVKDSLPDIKWNVNYSETKEVAGYLCNKATAEFRGSRVTAFYAKKLNYDAGPFKFGGLDGLILEVTEDDNDFNSWIATSVETNYVSNKIPILPKNIDSITLKQFIELKDKKNEEDFAKIISKAPKGTVIKRHKIKRNEIEKVYDWE